MPGKIKQQKLMSEVSKGYEKFIKGKEVNKDGKIQFNKAIIKAIKKSR